MFKEKYKTIKVQSPILKNVVKGMILLLVFSLPLFLGLGQVNILDLNKQALLILFVYLALLIWLLSGILKGGFRWRFQTSIFFIIAFLIAVLISTVFSRWMWGSFWGWPLDTASSFLTLLCFFILYLLVSNVFEKPRGIFLLQVLLIISGFFIALFGILQLSGRFLLPWNFTKTTSFNTIGTANSWGIFLGALLPLILALIFAKKGWLRLVLLILGIFIFSGLIICNYWVAWVEVLLSMTILLIFGLWKFGEIGPKFLVLPMILFSIALIFGVLKIPIPVLLPTPLEVSPSLRATFDVSKEMLKTLPKDLILGWGPGTFKYGWSKFKSALLNQTIFWNFRFSKGGAEILEMLGSIGILGTSIFVLLTVFVIYLGIKQLLIFQKEKKSFEWMLFLGTFSSFVGLSLIKFLYPSNVSLMFLWWLFLGNLGALSYKKERSFKLTADSKLGFLFSSLTFLVLIGGIFLFYLEGTRYLAEIRYDLALRSFDDLEKVEQQFLGAIRLNPSQEIFWRDLSQVYLIKAQQEVSRTDISDQERIQRVGNFAANAVTTAKRATEIDPENVANWQTRGVTYREIIGWSEGAFDWAVKSYERALELEPTNPFILVQLGRVYLIQASLVAGTPEATSLLEKAEGFIKRAIDLKPDYAQAFYQMALISEAQGKREEAITTLETLKQSSPFIATYDPTQDIGLAFQLGVLYYRDEQHDKAQIEFERAIALSPTYSNARYFLGLIYDEKGETARAIEQFSEIEKFNPENEEVKRILANLKEGKPALEGIVTTPEVLPIEEEPEEK